MTVRRAVVVLCIVLFQSASCAVSPSFGGLVAGALFLGYVATRLIRAAIVRLSAGTELSATLLAQAAFLGIALVISSSVGAIDRTDAAFAYGGATFIWTVWDLLALKKT